MRFPEPATIAELQKQWSDRFVRVKSDAPDDLKRFQGRVGRVVTVNFSGRAIVDFADGAWYDITNFQTVLEEVTDEAERKKYDPDANSVRKLPQRQG